MQYTWLQARGRLRGAPDCVDGVRDGNTGGGLASPYRFLGAAYPSFSLSAGRREKPPILRLYARHVLIDPNERLCSCPLLQREGLFGRQRETAPHRRGLRHSAQIDTGNGHGEDLRASRRKLHHHRRRTFSLRGSVAPARFHWYRGSGLHDFSPEQDEVRRLHPQKSYTPCRAVIMARPCSKGFLRA